MAGAMEKPDTMGDSTASLHCAAEPITPPKKRGCLAPGWHKQNKEQKRQGAVRKDCKEPDVLCQKLSADRGGAWVALWVNISKM